MFRRALHEPRVVLGVLLVAAAVLAGFLVKHGAEQQASRDFAACAGASPAPDCTTRSLPVSTSWTSSSANGFRRTYSVILQTGRHSSLSLNGLDHAAVRPFEDQPVADVRYRSGRLTAIVAADGTALEVPFAFTRRVLLAGALVGAAFLAGGGLLAWGLTRVNRTPVEPSGP